MNSNLSRLGLSVLAAFASPMLLAANLNAVDVASLPGDRVELKLSFDEPVAAPRGYTIEQPARIALDLPGVSSQLGVKRQELGAGNARSLTVVEADGRTRLIVNLDTLVPYSTRVDGNNLYLVLGEGAAPVQAAAPASVAPAAAPSAPLKPVQATTGRGVRNIDFQRAADGAGHVLITLSDASMMPSIDERGGKIRVRFDKAQLPEALRVRLDVQDFATPVKFINASSESDGASIAIEPTGAYEYLAFQTENTLTISVKPLSQDQLERQKAERFAYSGEKLSLNFQDIDVRSVLQLIADFTSLNLVASDTVQGNITLRLQNVPWDQALDLVLKTKGLDKRQIGNVLLVAPADEIAARERQELEARRQIAELAPLRREVVQVSYAKASDIAALFQAATGRDAGPDERGSVVVDDRTNNIIAYQTEERLAELRRIVTQLDIPVRQVVIEARIVEAEVGFDKSLGVRWGGNLWAGDKWAAYGKNGNLGVAPDPYATGTPGSDNFVPSRNTAGFMGIPQWPANSPFVDLGVVNSTSGLGLGFITDNTMLDLQLSAMESTGSGEIISQPKVLTSDKETAIILKGAEIPYPEATSSGAASIAWAEAVLSLEVTPQITPDSRIIMAVKVTKDEPNFTQTVNGAPLINKNEVNANVLVNDGETVVIGGVFSNRQQKSTEKVPFLGDMPFVGRLFRRDTVQDQKEELLIFLTPRILDTQTIAVSR